MYISLFNVILQDNKELGEKYGIHPRDVESKKRHFLMSLMYTFIFIAHPVLKAHSIIIINVYLPCFKNPDRICLHLGQMFVAPCIFILKFDSSVYTF